MMYILRNRTARNRTTWLSRFGLHLVSEKPGSRRTDLQRTELEAPKSTYECDFLALLVGNGVLIMANLISWVMAFTPQT